MPVRRQADGKVVEQPTRLVRPDRGGEAAEERTRLLGRLSNPGAASDEHARLVRRSRSGSPDRAGSKAPGGLDDPPVGWLVVVKGPGRGRALALGYGMNTIGRGEGSRVRLDFGDREIARANHARLTYEPRRRLFFLGHGDASNLTYLNGCVVLGPEEVAPGSMIELGSTTLRFQTFCSPDFDWSDLDD